MVGQSRGRRPEVGKGSAGVIDDVGVLLLVGVAEGVEEGLRVEVSSC